MSTLRLPITVSVPPDGLSDQTVAEIRRRLSEELATLEFVAIDAIDVTVDGDDRVATAIRAAVEELVAATTVNHDRLTGETRGRFDESRVTGGGYRLASYQDHGADSTVRLVETEELPTIAQVAAELRERADTGVPYPGYVGGIRGQRRNFMVFFGRAENSFWDFDMAHIPSRAEGDAPITSADIRHGPSLWSEGTMVEVRYRGPITEEWITEHYGDGIDAAREFLEKDPVRMALYVDGSFVDEFAVTAGLRNRSISFRVGRMVESTGDGAGRGGGNAHAGGERGETEGGDGDAQPGGGGPLGTAEDGARALWPHTDAGGEPLVCESYEGEKPFEELPPDVQERIRPEMERLARELEMDVCGYAGNFALMLAAALGGRAMAVGLEARNNPGKTTVAVRADGGGNNGIIDIAAEPTPALAYLRRLAELIGPVLTFGQIVQSNYDSLGDGGAVEYSTSWSIDFLNEIGDRLEASCARLFAETCRVILLQQLESTREVITHRRGPGLAETVSHFESVLGIMGERIVATDLMKYAIRRAGQLPMKGSVRDVLTAPDPMQDVGYYGGGNYSYGGTVSPAIHDSILLDLVAGAEVVGSYGNYRVRWMDREWTTSDLDEHRQLRRAFLNRIDPLFFQVENLRSVFTRVRREGAEAYLKDLLDEMLRANREVTQSTKATSDGHWFAVETSQYIEAQGGVSAFGTRYELHGIHGLADQELRPSVTSTWFYNQGVDRAIGRKAALDTLLMVFQTGSIIVLGIICAPLGAVVAGAAVAMVSIGFAVNDLMNAAERERIYRSLENPEQILSWTEVQLEWTMAIIGAAFSVFDVVAVGQAVRGGTALMRAAMRRGTQAVVRTEMRKVLVNVGRGAIEHALREAVQQIVLDQILQYSLPQLIRPALVPYMQSIAVEHGLGVDIEALLASGEAADEIRRLRGTTVTLERSEP